MEGVPVDKAMSSPVYKIPDTLTGRQALDEMEKKDVKKILVKGKDGTYLGVVERWKITELHMDKPVGKLELSPFKSFPQGTSMSALEALLLDLPAVYIHALKNPKTLVGVVTACDMMEAF